MRMGQGIPALNSLEKQRLERSECKEMASPREQLQTFRYPVNVLRYPEKVLGIKE